MSVCATKAQLLSHKGDIFSYIQGSMKESLLESRRDFISFFLLHVAEMYLCFAKTTPWFQESLSAVGRSLGTMILTHVPTAGFSQTKLKR